MDQPLAVFSWCTGFWVQQQKCCDADNEETHDKHRHPLVQFPLLAVELQQPFRFLL